MRTQHCTVVPHATIRGQSTSKVQNWVNFQTPDVSFRTSKPQAASAQGTPPRWGGGQFDFSYVSLEQPLQVFARDATDVGNRAMVGVRRSDKPGSWLNMKALDVDAVDAVTSPDGLTITYPGLWPGCDLVYEVQRHKLKESVVVWDKAIAPEYFEWTLKYPQGYSVDISSDVFALRDDKGVKDIETHAPWGEDSATTAPTMNGHSHIRCNLTEENARGGFRVVRLTPNPDDMATAIGTVRLDPTTTITGTSAIEDNMIYDPNTTLNYGAADSMWHGNQETGIKSRTIMRIVSGFPAGEITAFRLNFYRISHAKQTNAGTSLAYFIDDANAWVEGTGSGAPQVGSSNWDYAVADTLSWAGSGGCSTEGTDYDTDASPHTLVHSGYTTGPDIPLTYTLDEAWVALWRDSVRLNQGMLLRLVDDGGLPAGQGDFMYLRSTEHANAPTFEIDHVTPPGAKYFFVGF